MKFLTILLLLMCTLIFAQEIDPLDIAEQKELSQMNEQKQMQWRMHIKTQYKLTDEQINNYQNENLSFPGIVFALEMARQSDKSIDEIIKMRAGSKNGWGKIAKELGVTHSGLKKVLSENKTVMKKSRVINRSENITLRKKNRKIKTKVLRTKKK